MRAVGEDEVGADSGGVLAAFLEGEEGRFRDGEDGAAGSEADDLEGLEVVGWGKGIGKWEERVKGEGALEELGEKCGGIVCCISGLRAGGPSSSDLAVPMWTPLVTDAGIDGEETCHRGPW